MKSRDALLLIAPAAGLYLLSFAAPLLMAGRLSLFSISVGRETFVGLANYAKALADTDYLKSFGNVAWLVLFIAPLAIAIPYWMALLLQRFGRQMQSAGRFIAYVPSLTSGLIMALLWRWLLQRTGLVNAMLAHVGLPVVAWTGEPWPARAAVAMVTLSSGSGMFVILFSAVILAIPQELRESAFIDGATEGQYRRLVLRPILMPTILLALMLTIVGTLQSWDSIYVLFPTGGPKASVATPVYDIFMTAFMYSRPHMGAAKGVLALGVIAAVVAVQRRVEVLAGAER